MPQGKIAKEDSMENKVYSLTQPHEIFTSP